MLSAGGKQNVKERQHYKHVLTYKTEEEAKNEKQHGNTLVSYTYVKEQHLKYHTSHMAT